MFSSWFNTASSEQKQTRSKRIKWTIKVIQNLSLEKQTIQLIFYLTDHASTLECLKYLKLELLVVTCIYLILKLQGDLTSTLAKFNTFVTKNLQISRNNLLRTELEVLDVMPDHFVFLLTFSDYVYSIFPHFKVKR